MDNNVQIKPLLYVKYQKLCYTKIIVLWYVGVQHPVAGCLFEAAFGGGRNFKQIDFWKPLYLIEGLGVSPLLTLHIL